MRFLALKIDVDTLRGTREGVPNLVRLLQRSALGASFLFSLGPDHTGRAIRRVLRKGFLRKVQRTSVLEHYGIKTLLYGTLLPGPDIGLRASAQILAVAQAGFETGIHCWDHCAWQDRVSSASADWTRQQIGFAQQRHHELLGANARIHGAAGWQMNQTAFVELDRQGMQWSSDCRGTTPFIPVVAGIPRHCPQLPTTLPTLDELIGQTGMTPPQVVTHILELSAPPAPWGHVFTLHAELEGMRLLPLLELLIQGWQRQGYRCCSLSELGRHLPTLPLPHCPVITGCVPGRSGTLAVQGPPLAA